MHKNYHGPVLSATTKAILIFGIAVLCPLIGTASEERLKAPGTETETVISADLGAEVNPEGLLFGVGVYRRWIHDRDRVWGVPSSYVQAGVGAATSPGYGRVSVHGEWLPVVFAKVRLQYDAYRYYGAFGSLLSFPSGDAKFDKDTVKAMEGTEETGWGFRALIRPTLMAKVGPVVMTNQTDLAYYHFDGKGPYFLERTYDTLLKNGDHVLENRTNLLLEAWKGTGTASLLIGPYYEIVHAASADLVHARAGIMAYWVPRYDDSPGCRRRFFAQVGRHLRDPNREGEFTAAAGMGFDLDW